MSRITDQLGRLARIARAKADADLRRYAAYRAQSDAMRRHVETVRIELGNAVAAPASERPQDWRMTTALVAYHAGQLHQAEHGLAQMTPHLDAARTLAVQAFGRAEALARLKDLTARRERVERDRREP